MKIRVKVIFPDGKIKRWFLTDENTNCHYSQPVLVDGKNTAYKTADLPDGTLIKVENKEMAKRAKSAGYNIQN